QVVAAGAERHQAVELDVAGPGAAGRGVRPGPGQRLGRHRVGDDADVAEADVALRGAGGAERLAAVGDDAEVDVGVRRPGLEGAQDLALPRLGRARGGRGAV